METKKPLASFDNSIPGAYQEKVYPEVPYGFASTLRGQRRKAFKPLIAMVLFFVLYILFSSVVAVPFMSHWIAEGVFNAETLTPETLINFMDTSDPLFMAFLMLSVIMMIPAVFATGKIVYGQSFGSMISVERKFRFKLTAIAAGITAVLFAIYLPVMTKITGQEFVFAPQADFPLLLLVLVLTVPFQTFAEELMFRGWFFQVVGSTMRFPKNAFIIGAFVNTLLFVSLHGSTDPYTTAQLITFALAAVYLVWLTGGIEAGLGLHFANNFILLILDGVSGGQMNSLATAVQSNLFETATHAVVFVLICVIFTKIYRTYERKGVYTHVGQPVMATITYAADEPETPIEDKIAEASDSNMMLNSPRRPR